MGRPDFLGIGMERAGTSWLFTMLASHPGIWVPPLKELHYWDVIDPVARQYRPRYRNHLAARLKHLAVPLVRPEARPELTLNSWGRSLQWSWRYFTGRQTDAWYGRLFDPVFAGDRVRGEITPYYANVTAETIARIERMNPAMKYLLLVRDPAARAWSALVYRYVQIEGRPFDRVSEDEMLAWLDTPVSESRSDVAAILRTWQAAVPAERLFLGFFEEIALRPEDLLERCYRFVGVDPTFAPPASRVRRKINSRTRSEYRMPESVREKLDTKYRPLVEALAADHPDVARYWNLERETRSASG